MSGARAAFVSGVQTSAGGNCRGCERAGVSVERSSVRASCVTEVCAGACLVAGEGSVWRCGRWLDRLEDL